MLSQLRITNPNNIYFQSSNNVVKKEKILKIAQILLKKVKNKIKILLKF